MDASKQTRTAASAVYGRAKAAASAFVRAGRSGRAESAPFRRSASASRARSTSDHAIPYASAATQKSPRTPYRTVPSAFVSKIRLPEI